MARQANVPLVSDHLDAAEEQDPDMEIEFVVEESSFQNGGTTNDPDEASPDVPQPRRCAISFANTINPY